MKDNPKPIFLILRDIESEKLKTYWSMGDVWMAETAINRLSLRSIWEERLSMPFFGEASFFPYNEEFSEQALEDIIEIIESHYNEFTQGGERKAIFIICNKNNNLRKLIKSLWNGTHLIENSDGYLLSL